MSHKAKSANGNPLSIVWLRRDLRLHDHAALHRACHEGAPVQPVFVFDRDVLARFKRKADPRLTLIVRALCGMHEKIANRGGGILAFDGSAAKLLPEICHTLGASALIAGGDVEPETVKRDKQVKQALEGDVKFTLVKDHVLQAAHEVLKEDGTPYKVFTPYSKVWRAKLDQSNCLDEREVSKVDYADFAAQEKASKALPLIDLSQGVDNVLATLGYELAESEWKPEKARARLKRFVEHHIKAYKTDRDFMGIDGTSRLSPYLRFGILSVRECARAALEVESRGMSGASTWIGELIWRDFYSMILAHFPHSATSEFKEQYKSLKWSYDKQAFKRFTEGMTGYPIVDAAMRELLQTGVMHNRARMIVASFMTKDLQLDWRMGEEHFAQYLMDYELASNAGGWQWAASTGTDAQPYFRIFNPVLQSRKFDPKGDYIRRFVPELAELSDRDIHEPSDKNRPKDYPPPMVEHAKVKDKVLHMFKSDPS